MFSLANINSVDLYYAVGTVTVCGLVLLVYNYYIDPYKNIERFYFKTSKPQYMLFKLTYAVVLFSFIVSARFLVMKSLSS